MCLCIHTHLCVPIHARDSRGVHVLRLSFLSPMKLRVERTAKVFSSSRELTQACASRYPTVLFRYVRLVSIHLVQSNVLSFSHPLSSSSTHAYILLHRDARQREDVFLSSYLCLCSIYACLSIPVDVRVSLAGICRKGVVHASYCRAYWSGSALRFR